EREKRSIENEERDDREAGENRRLEAQRLPEHVAVPERVEPQRVDVVGERRSDAQQEDGKNGDDEHPAAPLRGSRRRPVDGLSHVSVELYSAVNLAGCENITRALARLLGRRIRHTWFVELARPCGIIGSDR